MQVGGGVAVGEAEREVGHADREPLIGIEGAEPHPCLAIRALHIGAHVDLTEVTHVGEARERAQRSGKAKVVHGERDEAHPSATLEQVRGEACGEQALDLGGIDRPVAPDDVAPLLAQQGAASRHVVGTAQDASIRRQRTRSFEMAMRCRATRW